MKFKLENKPYGLIELYDAVAREMGYADTSEINYDCRCINVAANIQDGLYEFYTAMARETNPDANIKDVRTSITMVLAINGPKVDINLADDEVEIFKGFIKE